VIFDVDFTLAKPGPDLGPEGYRRLGRLHGLELDPARYDEARRAAVDALERHPELDHDEEIWILFTQRIIEGMGGAGGDTYAAAVEMTRAWEHANHFELYDDALAALDIARRHSLKIGLLSNTARDLAEFATHHRLHVDALLTSRTHGKIKPHAAIFERMLELLEVEAEEALMVGDTLVDDIEGARAVGIRAVLVDREDRYPDIDDRVDGLWGFERLLRR
jgi:HAD superfamily hydrolase (TIGR01549 family)